LQAYILSMTSTRRYLLLFLFLNLLFSCTKSSDQYDLTYPVVRMDFSDEIVLDGSVEAIQSTIISSPDVNNSTIIYMIEDGTMVEAGDTVCILENQQLTDQLETVERLYEVYKAELNKGLADLELQYALLEAQVRNNETQMAISNLDSLQLKYYTPSQRRIAEIRLEMANIESRKLKKKLEALEKINNSELRKMELYIQQADILLQSIKDQLKQLVLITPKSGLALRGESDTGEGKIQEGEEAYPRKPLIIIPDPSQVRIKIQATETAYKRLSVGQKVEYSFDAMPGNYAQGSIAMKSPRGYTLSRNSRVKFFDVLATVDSSLQIPSAGLSANCRVFLNYLPDTVAVPIISVFQEDSINVVYVKKASGFVRQEVGIALQSSKEAVIACGLQGGEDIAMLQPPKSKIKAEVFLDCEQRNRYKPRKNDSIPDEFMEMPRDIMPQGRPDQREEEGMPQEGMPEVFIIY